MAALKIKCIECRGEHGAAEYAEAVAAGTLEQLCYASLIQRIDEAILTAKELASEAHRVGDEETAWLCRAAIADHEKQKASLRKPGEPRR